MQLTALVGSRYPDVHPYRHLVVTPPDLVVTPPAGRPVRRVAARTVLSHTAGPDLPEGVEAKSSKSVHEGEPKFQAFTGLQAPGKTPANGDSVGTFVGMLFQRPWSRLQNTEQGRVNRLSLRCKRMLGVAAVKCAAGSHESRQVLPPSCPSFAGKNPRPHLNHPGHQVEQGRLGPRSSVAGAVPSVIQFLDYT